MSELSTSTFRLSPQQAFLLGRGATVSHCVIGLDAGVDAAVVHERLIAAVARHESLRTTFETPAGARAPVAQTIHDELAPGWGESGDRLELVLASDAAALDLERGPSVRGTVVELADGGRAIVLTALAACADAQSLQLLARELTDPDGGGAEEPIQHADYAQWRHELAAGDDPDAVRGRAFWTGATEGLERSPRAGGGEVRSISVDVPESDELAALAAWAAVLARMTGHSELLLAELVDGRSQPDLEDAIGPYAQLAPVRVSIEPEATFAEALDRVRRARTEAIRWLDYGLDAELARVADGSLAGFVSGTPGSLQSSSGSTGSAVELAWGAPGHAEVRYDSSAVADDDATQLAGAFGVLLAAAISDPSLSLEALPLLDATGRAAVIELGTGPEATGSSVAVHVSFAACAARSPELAAVAGAGETLTYGALNARANQLAHHLIALGVTRDVPVGMCLTRTPSLLTAVLGIMKAGGGYLPLNAAHPAARIAHQLSESGASVVVTESALLDRLPAVEGVSIVCVDRDAAAIAALSSSDPIVTVGSGDLAYLMYTSGSTGLPKGVAVTHGNLANYTAAISARLGVEPGMQFALVSDISTDLGNTTIFPALAGGGCVHLISQELAMDGTALSAYASEHPLDVIKITPTHLRALLAADAGFLPRRWLVLGGEALSWELVDAVRDVGAGCRILNHYGPTEATIGCCTFEVVAGAPRPASATVPIGRPLAGARTFVLDSTLEPLPVGVAGELCIGGLGVARGYVGRPEETAARFVADPSGSRMYRTGDRARFHGDGSIEFLGRLDNQLKIRGYRVEPGEAEAALLRHPAVREAAVVAVADSQGDARLVAYFAATGEPGVADLQAFLAESLPDYMVPSRWVPISAFPLTPSGKIDRQALPDPDTASSGPSANFVAPRDEIEEAIAEIWGQLLGLDQVGVEDDFFALGGHSLLATQAIMRVRRVYGNIPLGAMFTSPTVAALAEVVRARSASS